MKPGSMQTHGSRIARAILFTSAILAFSLSFVFNWDKPGIQLPASAILLVTSFLYLNNLKRQPVNKSVALLLGLSVVLALFAVIRVSPVLIFINIVLSLFLISVAAIEYLKSGLLTLQDYLLRTWLLPLTELSSVEKVLNQSRFRSVGKLTPTQTSVVKGVLIALPVLVVFGLLFASADAVFADIFSGLFDWNIRLPSSLTSRLISYLAILFAVMGIFGSLFLGGDKSESPAAKTVDAKAKYRIELFIVLGSLNALFLSFIAIQAIYLFGGHAFVLDGELTYAEYGRQGFFELLAVSALVFGLAFAVKKFTSLKDQAHSRWLLYGLIAQVAIVMISALKRLGLYESAYGFTTLRFYSHSFIFFLALIFACLVYAIYKNKSEKSLLKAILWSLAVYVLALNFINPDPLIARQNIDRFERTGKLDALYIARLSDDAIDQKLAILSLERQPKGLAGHRRVTYLQNLCANYNFNHKSTWQTWHFGRSRAAGKVADAGLCEKS